MARHQLTAPLIVRGLKNPSRNSEVTLLQPVSYDDRIVDESWLQKLLFEHPTLLPISEIEAIFEMPLQICRELPVGAGAADLLFINRSGYLTIVETKLWRNPEAKHAAVAQIVKYASDMARWSYTDLVDSVKRRRKDLKGDPIIAILKNVEGEEFDERSFIDRVSRNLRDGRFLLLIVGDGIREDVEQMAAYLQKFPTLGFALGLVEISLYRENPDSIDPIIVQPRILACTEIVERTVIEIRGHLDTSDVVVTTVEPQPSIQHQYWRKLHSQGEGVVEFVHEVLSEAPDHGLRVQWMKAGPVLKYDDDSRETFFNFGQLHWQGVLSEPGYLFFRFAELSLPLNICRDYFDAIAELIPSTFHRLVHKGMSFETERLFYGNRAESDGYIPLQKLAPVKQQWLVAIDKTIDRILKATAWGNAAPGGGQ